MAGSPPLRLAELAATLALAQDHAFGQPPGSQLRACLLGQLLGTEVGLDPEDLGTAYWLALFRFLGCTGHAHEVSVVFGDEIAMRRRSLLWDPSNTGDVLKDIVAHGGSQHAGLARVRTVAAMLAGGRRAAEMNFRTGCEVADALAARLALPDDVRTGLGFTFERWNGHGFPQGAKGDGIPLAMRLVTLCHEAEVLSRVHGPDEAGEIVRRRAGKAYDPDLAAALVRRLEELTGHLDTVEPWDEVLATEAGPPAVRAGEALDEALAVVADFADLKSPYTAGHSRGVAALARDAARIADLRDDDVTTVHRAGLVHDIGRVHVPNSIWDKAAVLTRSERDDVRPIPS